MKDNKSFAGNVMVKGILLGIYVSVACAFLAACASSTLAERDELELALDAPYVSPYDFDGLTLENGRFAYTVQGELVSRTGIDVSSHQRSIDWQAVATDDIEFAFIRLGYRGYSEGLLNLDEYFEENYRNATEAGLEVGVYFFSQALTEEEARAEAQFVLDQLSGRQLDYPIAYDFEPVTSDGDIGRANTIEDHQRTSNAVAFCEVIEAAGYPTMIYGNTKDINAYYLEVLGDRPIWFAEYDAAFPSGQFDFVIWQYSSTGEVSGITTGVDLNIELVHKE